MTAVATATKPCCDMVRDEPDDIGFHDELVGLLTLPKYTPADVYSLLLEVVELEPEDLRNVVFMHAEKFPDRDAAYRTLSILCYWLECDQECRRRLRAKAEGLDGA